MRHRRRSPTPRSRWPRRGPCCRRARRRRCWGSCVTGHPPTVDPAEVLAQLSPREREVARALATGASNDDIARRLFLSANTVKTHVKAVLAKLDVPDRVHVVIWAYENGLLRPRG
ncbi:response regulator transcription factor [Microbacterium sp. NPDC060132]|uniref:response regulator transcription factor n=1 Tax=unclassified Microbacterium TaxID=2609290 RepID=UPI0036500D19